MDDNARFLTKIFIFWLLILLILYTVITNNISNEFKKVDDTEVKYHYVK